MKLRTLNFLRHFLITVSLVLSGVSANAIMTGPSPVPAVQTPLLMKEFKAAGEQKEKDQWGEKEYLSYDFAYIRVENVSAVFSEILKATGSLSEYEALTFKEFKKLQVDLVRRGYEPAVNTNWVNGKRLILRYGGNFFPGTGPRQIEDSTGKTVYRHDLEYEFQINFQRKGQPLQSFEDYPAVSLNGFISLECQSKWDDCRVYVSYGKSVEISWDSVPGYKTGGNSSAGGGPRTTLNMDNVTLTKEEIEKISKSQKSK